MNGLKACPECQVPDYITSEHLWLDNGDIVQKRNQAARLVFFESENIDPLFRNIQEIIGVPIEHMVINSVRRAVRIYVSLIVTEDTKEAIRRKEMDPIPIALEMMKISKIMGCGGEEFVDYRYERDDDDYYIVTQHEPFSVPLVAGTTAGAVEAILGGDRGVTCEQISPEVYKMTITPSPHPEELKQRMQMDIYRHRAGDIELDRCAVCGGPQALAGYRWYLDRGICLNRTTRRRMVMMSPQVLDVIFSELREELGDAVDEAVVEAQRRFTRSGFYSIDDVGSEADFRTMLALRGLGNLKEIKIRKKGLQMRLENAALPLMIVGMMQGAFDALLGLESTVEWELSDQNTLEIEVSHA